MEIFKTKELEQNQTTQKIRAVQNEGVRKVSREVTYKNISLKLWIAIGESILKFIRYRQNKKNSIK
ncbi:MAG: hypothetical protein IKF97_01470 [Clostridia bacterium]|nr:hypothetical protein [Clostridia bacterium]